MSGWIPLARPLQASRGVHFDLQASVMAGCVSASFVFWSPRRSLSHHHTYLATTTLSTTLWCHGLAAHTVAKEPLHSSFPASTRCCLTCPGLPHKETQRHVDGLQSIFNTAPDCLC